MTTKDIIKFLPLDNAIKIELLEKFDSLDSSQLLSIERLVWNTYDTLYQQLLEENIQKQYAQTLNNEGKFNQDFYAEALKKTESTMNKEFFQTTEQVDLSAARKAMDLIVKELQAAKN